MPPKSPAMVFDRSEPGVTVVTEWLRDGVLAFADEADHKRRTRYDSDGAVIAEQTVAVDQPFTEEKEN